MKHTISLIALSAGLSLAQPAFAQDEALTREELSEMRAAMAAMAARIDALEADLVEAEAKTAEASAAAAAANSAAGEASAAAAKAAEGDGSTIKWKGAPLIEGKGGWSFKPRGRLMYDVGFTNAPASTGRPDGFGNEARRIRLGVEGDMPGGFGYKFELDFSGGEVDATDAYLSYSDGPIEVMVGQHNNFQSLDELTSSLHSSFIERAAFTDAFGFERRVGASLTYKQGIVLAQAGLFTDNINDTSTKNRNDTSTKNRGADARVVLMPKMGETQLHFGGSFHYNDLDDPAATVRYRQRPLVHFTSERFVNTGNLGATSETGYGLEAAAISGPFHAAAETYWQHVNRPGALSDPTFFGGYAEVGYFLTKGDTRGYKSGKFDRVKPANPVGKGGIGSVQLNLRYDYLDLSDAGIIGGTQNAYQASLVWKPTDYTLFALNYGKQSYHDAVYAAAGGDRSYSVDAVGVRAQVDF